jgi:hypothetical protein
MLKSASNYLILLGGVSQITAGVELRRAGKTLDKVLDGPEPAPTGR